jgi:hypothetical protein
MTEIRSSCVSPDGDFPVPCSPLPVPFYLDNPGQVKTKTSLFALLEAMT